MAPKDFARNGQKGELNFIFFGDFGKGMGNSIFLC